MPMALQTTAAFPSRPSQPAGLSPRTSRAPAKDSKDSDAFECILMILTHETKSPDKHVAVRTLSSGPLHLVAKVRAIQRYVQPILTHIQF